MITFGRMENEAISALFAIPLEIMLSIFNEHSREITCFESSKEN